ncbi:hypothetical protein LEP1GSC043_4212 [Leptospira weilii str. Ecochallenge]|uniref:Uncharacterized protein n=3 Tax=Leptospira weilii TaxID=28184 RepID=N1U768_9LEPT|nr:hypothetical protein LEP1GSC038_4807 [Leptospira weilii str. 2006001855]EMN89112.1 hypothetical protein LEP1GSC108_0129 [Leptospira weilii str. UI 13098]EMY14922.1 hypothetical protein LEP1GSC043_4212 [Leptospira weilii str. Ecochallenge]
MGQLSKNLEKSNNKQNVSFQFQRKAKNFCKICLTRQMRFILWSLPLFFRNEVAGAIN